MKSPSLSMNHNRSTEFLRQSRRDTWAGMVAASTTGVHLLATCAALSWYFFVVPRIKHDLEQVGQTVSSFAKLAIWQSDMAANYWYLLLPIIPLATSSDFRVTRWIGKELGLRRAAVFAVCIAMILVINVAFSQYVLLQWV